MGCRSSAPTFPSRELARVPSDTRAGRTRMEIRRSSTEPELLEEFCLGLLHAARGVGIAQCGSDALEGVDAESRAQVLNRRIERQQRFERSSIAFVANPLAASRVDLDIGLGAGAMVVQVGIQELPVEENKAFLPVELSSATRD